MKIELKIIHSYRVHPGTTGSSIFLDELSRELSKRGHHVSIFTSDLKRWYNNFDFYPNQESYKEKIRIKQVPFTIFRFINSRFAYSKKYIFLKIFDRILFRLEHGITKFLENLFNRLNVAILWGLFQDELGWKMLCYLNKEKNNIIHTTCVPRSCIVASLLIARKKKIPIMISPFYHYRDRSFNIYDKFWMRILNKFDCINVCTDAERNYLINHGVDRNKIVKICLGISLKNQETNIDVDWKNRINIPKDKFTVLYMNANIGDIQKGILQVIGASIKLHDVEFIFAGNDINAWIDLISKFFPNKKLKNCHYIGYVLENEKKSLFKAVDLIVRPSINEALGIIYLEGMREGKPIITSNIESMKEISKDVGLSVDHGNIDELVKAIKKIKSDHQLYQKFSENALKKSMKYNWEYVSKKFEKIYNILINKFY